MLTPLSMLSPFVMLATIAQGTMPQPAETGPTVAGVLVGCAFPEEGATEDRPAWSGFSIFLPENRGRGPVDVSLIRDPEGIFGRSGFDTVESGLGWLHLRGRSSLRLTDAGGGIYRAQIQTETDWAPPRQITCQMGRFDSPAAAFQFFDEVMRGLNDPEP